MQAIILAAGESSRFYPFNDSHKSMVKIMGKTILEHTLISVKESGIKNVVIVTSDNNKIKELFGDGSKLGLNIKYVTQAQATGMGDALLLAEKYLESNFFFLHAHHIDFHKFKDLLLGRKINNEDIVLLTKKINDPLLLQKMGVLKIEDEKVVEIVEKPLKGTEPSDLGVIGIYLLNIAFVENLKKIPKEHYNFEKSISHFAKKADVRFAVTDIDNVSLKYPWDILSFKDHLFSCLKKYIAKSASISASSQISGEVYIDENVKVMENAAIKGPCYIGRNAYVGNNSILRQGVDLEENSVIGANMEFKNTLMMKDSKVHSGFIGDSVIGKNCRIGAGFNTANVRLDRATVKTIVKNEKIDTGQKSLGVMVGNDTRIGIKSSSMPGIIIGRKATIGSNTVVAENVADNTKYYTEFQKVVVKKMNKKFVLFDIDFTLFDTQAFKDSQLTEYASYKEVISVLENLSEIAELGIFSKGESEFQKTKLEKTGMARFFKEENIHIFIDKDVNLINVLEKYKDLKIFLVDDKLEILHSAKKCMEKVFTIWVKRGWFAENQKPIPSFKSDAEVENLSEVVRIVQSN